MFGGDVIYFLVYYVVILEIDGLVLYMVGCEQIIGDIFWKIG